MKDESILEKIASLVEREHHLRGGQAEASSDEASRHRDLRAVEVELDQCWDLLRQRRAKQEFGSDPDEATSRSPSVVESYWQ